MAVLYFSGCLYLLTVVFANDKDNIHENNTSMADDQPPYFVESPPIVVLFKDNESVELRYITAGSLPSAFKWKKNGVDLDLNARNIRQDSGVIRISPTTHLDEGFYQCIAENKYGITVSNVSQLQRAVLQPVGLTQQTTQLEAVDGQPFVMRASTFKVVPMSGSAEQHVWMKYAGDLDVRPQRIVADRRIQIAPNGDLHFAYVNSSDALNGKLYVDAVYNTFLNITIEGNYTQLTVKSNPTGVQPFPPTLAFSSMSQSPALEGENVTMRCFFSGKEEPILDWLLERGNPELGRLITSEDKTGLTIINVTASDEMLYYCMATNDQGSKTTDIALKIEASPRFVKQDDGPQNTRVLDKDNAVFRCNAYAKPEADIVWIYNGQSLSEHPRKRFVISADNRTLTISSVCLECQGPNGVNVSDSGVVQCNASNVHGYALGTGYLNVISMQSGGVIGSGAARENSVPFEVAFIILFTISILFSF